MPQAFNIYADLVVRGPVNVRPVVQSLRAAVGNIPATITPVLSPTAGRTIASLTSGVKSLNANLSAATTNARAASQALAGLGVPAASASGLGSLNAGLAATVSSAAAARKGVGGVATGMDALGQSVGIVARRFLQFYAVTRIVRGVESALGEAAKEALDFQHEMVRLGQVGASASAIGEISKEITNLSTSLGVSSRDLASVSTTLKQAGLSADEVRTSLAALAKTTLAPTFESITNTTEGLIALRQQFGVAAKDIEGYLGSINTVSAVFAVESEDLITAIRKTGGAFKAASSEMQSSKQSFDQLLGLFTSVRATTRESADEISTGLRTIFGRLQSNAVASNLKDMGINLRYSRQEAQQFGTVVEGEFVGAYEAIRRLSAATKGLSTTDPRFAQIATEIGGYRQISRVIPLLQQFGQAQKAVGVAQGGTTSLTQDAVKSQASYARQIAKVREEFFELIRTVSGDTFFRDLVSTFAQGASAAIKLAGALKPLIPLLAAVAVTSVIRGGLGFARNFGTKFAQPPLKYASGGVIPGSGRGDKVPIDAHPGDFILRRDAVRTAGPAVLHARFGGGKSPHRPGPVPILTEPGEYYVPAAKARGFGYANLHRLNRTGRMPRGYAAGGPIVDTNGYAEIPVRDLPPRRRKSYDGLAGAFGRPLTWDQSESLRGYSGSRFSNYNKTFRKGVYHAADDEEQARDMLEGAFGLDAGLHAAPRAARPTVVYRGVKSRRFLGDLRPGDIHHEPGLLSTSFNRDVARHFAGKHGAVTRIVLPRGTPLPAIRGFSKFKWEDEVLLPLGSKLEYRGERGGDLRFRHRGFEAPGHADIDRMVAEGYAHGGLVQTPSGPPAYTKSGRLAGGGPVPRGMLDQIRPFGLGDLDYAKVVDKFEFVPGLEMAGNPVAGLFLPSSPRTVQVASGLPDPARVSAHELIHAIDFEEGKRRKAPSLGYHYASSIKGHVFNEAAALSRRFLATGGNRRPQDQPIYAENLAARKGRLEEEDLAWGFERYIHHRRGLEGRPDYRDPRHESPEGRAFHGHVEGRLLPYIRKNYGPKAARKRYASGGLIAPYRRTMDSLGFGGIDYEKPLGGFEVLPTERFVAAISHKHDFRGADPLAVPRGYYNRKLRTALIHDTRPHGRAIESSIAHEVLGHGVDHYAGRQIGGGYASHFKPHAFARTAREALGHFKPILLAKGYDEAQLPQEAVAHAVAEYARGVSKLGSFEGVRRAIPHVPALDRALSAVHNIYIPEAAKLLPRQGFAAGGETKEIRLNQVVRDLQKAHPEFAGMKVPEILGLAGITAAHASYAKPEHYAALQKLVPSSGSPNPAAFKSGIDMVRKAKAEDMAAGVPADLLARAKAAGVIAPERHKDPAHLERIIRVMNGEPVDARPVTPVAPAVTPPAPDLKVAAPTPVEGIASATKLNAYGPVFKRLLKSKLSRYDLLKGVRSASGEALAIDKPLTAKGKPNYSAFNRAVTPADLRILHEYAASHGFALPPTASLATGRAGSRQRQADVARVAEASAGAADPLKASLDAVAGGSSRTAIANLQKKDFGFNQAGGSFQGHQYLPGDLEKSGLGGAELLRAKKVVAVAASEQIKKLATSGQIATRDDHGEIEPESFDPHAILAARGANLGHVGTAGGIDAVAPVDDAPWLQAHRADKERRAAAPPPVTFSDVALPVRPSYAGTLGRDPLKVGKDGRRRDKVIAAEQVKPAIGRAGLSSRLKRAAAAGGPSLDDLKPRGEAAPPAVSATPGPFAGHFTAYQRATEPPDWLKRLDPARYAGGKADALAHLAPLITQRQLPAPAFVPPAPFAIRGGTERLKLAAALRRSRIATAGRTFGSKSEQIEAGLAGIHQKDQRKSYVDYYLKKASTDDQFGADRVANFVGGNPVGYPSYDAIHRRLADTHGGKPYTISRRAGLAKAMAFAAVGSREGIDTKYDSQTLRGDHPHFDPADYGKAPAAGGSGRGPGRPRKTASGGAEGGPGPRRERSGGSAEERLLKRIADLIKQGNDSSRKQTADLKRQLAETRTNQSRAAKFEPQVESAVDLRAGRRPKPPQYKYGVGGPLYRPGTQPVQSLVSPFVPEVPALAPAERDRLDRHESRLRARIGDDPLRRQDAGLVGSVLGPKGAADYRALVGKLVPAPGGVGDPDDLVRTAAARRVAARLRPVPLVSEFTPKEEPGGHLSGWAFDREAGPSFGAHEGPRVTGPVPNRDDLSVLPGGGGHYRLHGPRTTERERFPVSIPLATPQASVRDNNPVPFAPPIPFAGEAAGPYAPKAPSDAERLAALDARVREALMKEQATADAASEADGRRRTRVPIGPRHVEAALSPAEVAQYRDLIKSKHAPKEAAGPIPVGPVASTIRNVGNPARVGPSAFRDRLVYQDAADRQRDPEVLSDTVFGQADYEHPLGRPGGEQAAVALAGRARETHRRTAGIYGAHAPFVSTLDRQTPTDEIPLDRVARVRAKDPFYDRRPSSFRSQAPAEGRLGDAFDPSFHEHGLGRQREYASFARFRTSNRYDLIRRMNGEPDAGHYGGLGGGIVPRGPLVDGRREIPAIPLADEAYETSSKVRNRAVAHTSYRDRAQLRRSLADRLRGRSVLAPGQVDALSRDDRRNLIDQAQARYDPDLVNKLRAGQADVLVGRTGGLAGVRARGTPPPSRLGALGTALTQERYFTAGGRQAADAAVAAGQPRPRGGIGLGRSIKNFGRFSQGLGFIGAAYAPMILEQGFGTVANPKGTREGARDATALGGGISGLAIGAQVGGILGPWGAAVGGLVGAVAGYTSSLKQAQNEIDALDFAKSAASFGRLLDNLASGHTEVNAASIGSLNKGLDESRREAGRRVTAEGGGGNFFDRNIGTDNLVGRTLSGGFRRVGSGLSSLTGGTGEGYSLTAGSEGILADEAKQRSTKYRELLTPQLGQFQAVGEKLAQQVGTRLAVQGQVIPTSDIDPSQAAALKRQRLDTFSGSGGDQIARTIAEINNIPVEEVKDEFDKLIVTAVTEKQRLDAVNRSAAQAAIGFEKFHRVADAADAAATALLATKQAGETISRLFEGQAVAGHVVGHAEAATQFGGPDPAAFRRSVQFTRGNLGDSDLARHFADSTGTLDSLKRSLSGDIVKALHGSSFGEDQIVGDVSKAFRGQAPENRDRLTTAAQAMDPKELQQRAREDPSKLASDLFEKAFGGVDRVFADVTRKLQERANEFADGMAQAVAKQDRVKETLDRAATQGLAASRAGANLKAIQTGRPADDFLPLATLRAPFAAHQKTLAGPNVQDPFDVDQIANRLKAIPGLVAAKQRTIQDGATTPAARSAAQADLASLSGESANLLKALEHLGETTAEVAAIQEKLALAEKERAGQLSFTEKLLTADPRERAEMNRGGFASDVAVRQGNFAGFSAQNIGRALAHLESLRDVKLPAYGGRTGGEVREGLLDDARRRLGFGGRAAGVDRDRGDLAGQQKGVEDKGVAALQALAGVQRDLADKFIANLQAQNTAFLAELHTLIAEGDARDKGGAAERAGVGAIKARGEANRLQGVEADYGSVPRARKLLESAGDLADLKKAKDREATLQGKLTAGAPAQVGNLLNLGRYRNSIKGKGTGTIDVLGHQVTTFGRSNDPEVEGRRFEAHRTSLEGAAGAIGEATGLTRDQVAGVALPKYLGEMKDAHANRTPFDPGTAMQRALTATISGVLADERAKASGLRDAVADRVTGNHDKAGRDLADKAAANLPALQKALEGLNHLATLGQAAEAAARATEAETAATEAATAAQKRAALLRQPAAPPEHKATGGVVGLHPGRPRGTDTVPAWLSVGEHVTNARQARANASLLTAINAGNGPVMLAEGGDVEDDLDRRFRKQRIMARDDLTRSVGDRAGFTNREYAEKVRDEQADRAYEVQSRHDARLKRITDRNAAQEAARTASPAYDATGDRPARIAALAESTRAKAMETATLRRGREIAQRQKEADALDWASGRRAVPPLPGVAPAPAPGFGPPAAGPTADPLAAAAANAARFAPKVDPRGAAAANAATYAGRTTTDPRAEAWRRDHPAEDAPPRVLSGEDRARQEAAGDRATARATAIADRLRKQREALKARQVRNRRATDPQVPHPAGAGSPAAAGRPRRRPTTTDFLYGQGDGGSYAEQLVALYGFDPSRPVANTYGNRAAYGFAAGGFVPRGTDDQPAMLSRGEFVVNRAATAANLPVLQAINKATTYRAAGGTVGGDPAGGQPATSRGGLAIDAASLAALQRFQKSFGTAATALAAPAEKFASAAESLARAGKSLEGLAAGVGGLEAAVKALSPIAESFAKLGQTLAGVSIPASIVMQTKAQVEVLLNGGGVVAAMKGDMAVEVTRQVMEQLPALIQRTISDMPAR